MGSIDGYVFTTHAYIRTYVYTYVYTYVHTYVHTYIHTYICSRNKFATPIDEQALKPL